jgi:hypothetical protein
MSALDTMTDDELRRLKNRLNEAFILLDEYEADCGCQEQRKCGKCRDKQKLMEEEQ